jgi:hypothetical protein
MMEINNVRIKDFRLLQHIKNITEYGIAHNIV